MGFFLFLARRAPSFFCEIAHLGFHIVSLALLGACRLAVRALLPVAHGAFVPADVHIVKGEDLFDRVKRVLDELFGSRFLGANQLGGNAAVRPYLGALGIAAEFRVGGRQCILWPGHFHFRQYLDAACIQ